MSKPANRSLDDWCMDDIDHALGRPFDPLGETYRDYYCANAGSREARHMAHSPHWLRRYETKAGIVFTVTPAGREALADYLFELEASEYP